ncbi:Eosinophil peroxidase [Oryzias melastigma]|uniref:Eosinophil peroxidase n=1 Tax=Oryzias melastigma TaxID=30732 RepID=A0A834C5V4_ORYME|nr:Eosinophil peroxidase [Oryzias melastigma]
MLLSVLFVLGISLVPAHFKPTGETLGSPFLQQCFEDAKKLVDDAYKYSREESLRRVRKEVVRPHDALRLLKQPRGDTRSAVRSADYMAQTLRLVHDRVHHVHKRSLNATDLLTGDDMLKLAEISGCAARVPTPTVPHCPQPEQVPHSHQNNPRLGASNTPFTRWLPAEYDDGISQPKGWNRNRTFNNFMLPLVRQVSNNILSMTDAGVVNDDEFTHMVTLFGQWNDHDLSFTPVSPSIRSFSNGCIPAFRSAPVCGTGYSAYNFGGEPNKREQINALTAFLDLGQVYGSEEKLALYLRNLSSDAGLMRVNTEFRDKGRELLPFHPMQVQMCATRRKITNNPNAQEVPCFIAGDVRVDENIALTSIHTLFLREHNRLARQLKRLNPHWDSETLYQEARKIMGAYTQKLVFKDYLPHIVGDEAMKKQLDQYPGYNSEIDPSIANVFATAAYRFAHLAIQPSLSRLDENYREHPLFPSVPLYEAFFTPWRVVFEGGIDPVLRGLLGQPAKLNTQDQMMVDALRERLFQFVQRLALDLGSLNMQRSRDHGIPGYNAWRKFCGLSQPRNVAELSQVLGNEDLARRLLQLYGTADNIDVWLGGVAEPFVRGGRVGPLFACLIATQFQKIRQGDRLWYENPGVFTRFQRNALRSVRLSKIICDNTDITSVPVNVFKVVSRQNRRVLCSRLSGINMSPWRDRSCVGENCFGNTFQEDLYKEDLNNIDLDELDQIDPEVDQDLEVDPENLNNEIQ